MMFDPRENQAAGMTSPVRCGHCGGVYDLGTVTVTARYADCSVWRSPCCGRTVDDRPAGWKAYADYTEIDKSQPMRLDPLGRPGETAAPWTSTRTAVSPGRPC